MAVCLAVLNNHWDMQPVMVWDATRGGSKFREWVLMVVEKQEKPERRKHTHVFSHPKLETPSVVRKAGNTT